MDCSGDDRLYKTHELIDKLRFHFAEEATWLPDPETGGGSYWLPLVTVVHILNRVGASNGE